MANPPPLVTYNPNVDEDGNLAKGDVAKFPVFDTVYTPDDYASVFMKVAPTVFESWASHTAIGKSSALPPDMQSFATFSLMPEVHNGGVIQVPGIPFEALRKIARENLAPQMIIGMRVDDVQRYSELSSHPWKPGWRVELRAGLDSPTAKDLQDIKDAERFLLNCNIDTEWNARKRDARRLDGFGQFLAKIVRDSLTYDGMAIWTDCDLNGRVKAFAALSAFNVRLCGPQGFQGNPDIPFVATDDSGNILQTFTREELTWYVRNPRADPDIFGYGYCYDAETEVLTRNGWKTFDKVDISIDEFATMNMESREFQWQKATARTWQPYVGTMYQLHSQSVDMLVTPNHKLPLISGRQSDKFRIMTAEDAYNKIEEGITGLRLPISCDGWRGEEIKEKIFEGRRYNEKTTRMTGDQYCAFMGAYLSEGHVDKLRGTVNISQMRKSKGWSKYNDLLTEIFGSEPYYYKEVRFILHRKVLAEHLSLFGAYAHEKCIPDEIMNASKKQIEIFLDNYIAGDGCSHRRPEVEPNGQKQIGRLEGNNITIVTASKRMAEQLQELIQKTGYSSRVYEKAAQVMISPQDRIAVNDGKILSCRSYDTRPIYTVKYHSSKYRNFHINKTNYAGYVGCVSVPNKIILTRRNGKVIWGHNSEIEMGVKLIQGFSDAMELNTSTFNRNAIPNGFLIAEGAFTQRQLDVLSRIWSNLKKGTTKSWAIPVISLPKDADLRVVPLMDLKGEDGRYDSFMNMLIGAFCTIYRFPVNRIGYKASGMSRDSYPRDAQADATLIDENDNGLMPLLHHLEVVINEYLLWTRWPHLKFTFCAKNPKEDLREYEARMAAATLGEHRKLADLPPLETLAKGEEEKKLARIMALCPKDSALSSVYQAIVATSMKTSAEEQKQDSEEEPNAEFGEKTDPVKSAQHGHASGVKRDSAAERKQAKS